YLPAVLNLKTQHKIKTFENDELSIIRFTQPINNYNENIVDVNFKLVITEKQTKTTTFCDEIHKMRYFSLPEINLFAKLNNFEVVKSEEFLTRKEPSENTWGICMVLRKK
ncbi:MAG: hypothetical protein K8H86_09055, partial [Ignavibacteriaceae bacterium]|nr:hypothetical protein [Ignavibacteriaceae bacterium]